MLWGEGILGALYVEDFKRLAQKAGFTDPRVLHSAPITNQDPEVAAALGNVRLFSITFRLFKLPGLLEAPCQDSSQRAYVRGLRPAGMPTRYGRSGGSRV